MPVNSINQDQEYAFQSSEFMSLSYLNWDNNWTIVPGITDYSVSGGSSPSRDVVAANTSVAKRIGRPRTGDVSISAYYMPTDHAWRKIREAQLNRELMHWRLETNGDVVWQSTKDIGVNITVAANTGGVTFTGGGSHQSNPTLDNHSMGRGSVIALNELTGTRAAFNFIVDTVSSSGQLSVLDLSETATEYGRSNTGRQGKGYIWNPPPMRYEFSAYVTQGADSNMPAEGELTTTLMLTPRKPLPNPVIIIDALRPDGVLSPSA